MKNIFRIVSSVLLLCVAMAFMPEAHAGAHYLNDTKLARVHVVLKNGDTFDGRIKLPDGWSTKPVKVTPDEGKARKFKPEEIAALVVWEKKHPDKQFVMRRITRPYYNKKGQWKRDNVQWMFVEAAGEHLTIYMGATMYEFNKRNGTLVGLAQYNSGFSSVGVKTGAEKGVYIGNKKSLMDFLSDDPTICRRLEANEISANDYQTIVDVYEPVE
ncbi:MAG: hypothetical protein K2L01_02720 [Rikenellaceae bacterium]|nr:hypothetical protein [Rikenellaceae bacterium]